MIDPDGRDIIKIIRTTTFYPSVGSGLDGGGRIGGGASNSLGYTVIKAPGKDVFYYNTVTVHLSANGGNDKIVAGKPKEFYPNDFQVTGSGITQSDGAVPGQKVNDIDFISLAKLAPPGLISILEKKDKNAYGGLRLASASLSIGEAGRELAGNSLLLEAAFSGLPKRGALHPNEINFSQRTVSENVEQYVADMKNENWDWNRSGPIRIMEQDGKWVTYDNRRLMAAQQAGLDNIPHEIVKPTDIMPGSKKTWGQAFHNRFNDPRNIKAGGVVPNGGLSSQPTIAK